MSATNISLPAPYGLLPNNTVQQGLTLSPFGATVETGSISPPASSCSTGTALGPTNGSGSTEGTPANSGGNACGHVHATHHHRQPQQGVASMMIGNGAVAPGAASYCPSKEWLYRLVTFPAYFTPCQNCCTGCRTPKREQLMTLFDTKFPHKVFCSHCPECQIQGGSSLLQVRRASFKDVVKATDIVRFGADIGGVQQYTLNGSKVIYLNREAATEKKPTNGSAAPAMCTVDGRAMMDKTSLYCSMKCKMQAEDPGFTNWLDSQDPAVRIMADIAANAPPRPTVACKRTAQPTSSGSSGGSAPTESGGSGGSSSGVVPTMLAGRPKKLQRTTSSGGTIGAAAGAPAGQGTGDESAAPRAAKQRAAAAMQRAASLPQGPPAGLKPIKTSITGAGVNRAGLNGSRPGAHNSKAQHQQALLLPASMANPLSRQSSAPSAFLEAAMAEPQLGPSGLQYGTCATQPLQIPAPACVSGSSWLAGPTELDHALSCTGTLASWETFGSWESGGISSPAFALGVTDSWEDGSLSPALITAPTAHGFGAAGETGLGSGMEDWWLPSSPAFATAGLAGF